MWMSVWGREHAQPSMLWLKVLLSTCVRTNGQFSRQISTPFLSISRTQIVVSKHVHPSLISIAPYTMHAQKTRRKQCMPRAHQPLWPALLLCNFSSPDALRPMSTRSANEVLIKYTCMHAHTYVIHRQYTQMRA